MTVESRSRADGVVLEVENLVVEFPAPRSLTELLRGKPRRRLRAVDGVSFTVSRHETLGLVGESGSGKTTLGRALLKLYRPSEGRINFSGCDLATLKGKDLRGFRDRKSVV